MHIDSFRILTIFLGENSTREISEWKFINLFFNDFWSKYDLGSNFLQVTLTSLEIKGEFIRWKFL